jgi:hypothetical protein
MPSIGSRSWAQATGGALSAATRLRFAGQAVAEQLRALPTSKRERLARSSDARALLTGERAAPDTGLARAVASIVDGSVSGPLHGHSIRTWIWGELLGNADRLEFDSEELYVASLLHDVALTDTHRPGTADDVGCFAVHGSRVARGLLVDLGAPAPTTDTVADAIAWHMNNRVGVEVGPVAHLLHAGAHLDVVGRRASELPQDVVAEVVAAHPRDGFARCFVDLMARR